MQYEQLRAQFELPSLEILQNSFEFELDEKKNPVRVIRRSMCERVEQFIGVLEGLFHADGANASSMHEIENLSSQDHGKALRVYRKLMYLLRYGQSVAVTFKVEDEAEYIKETFEAWPAVVEDVSYLLNKLKSAWTIQKTKQKDVAYLG